jgi:hypothetical protein
MAYDDGLADGSGPCKPYGDAMTDTPSLHEWAGGDHAFQTGAAVVEQAPVPRWGWGVGPPYQP